jgi:hypothetical protein
VCQEWTVPFVVRDATVGDAAAVQDVFHRSPLSKLDGRADLLAHPEVLTFEPTSPADRRVRVAIPAQGGRVIGFASTALDDRHFELVDVFADRTGCGEESAATCS